MLMCMCMLNRRAQILFNKDLWGKLERKAKAQNSSIGELIRKAVEKDFEQEKQLEQRKQAIDATLMGRIISKGKIDYKDLINYGRK